MHTYNKSASIICKLRLMGRLAWIWPDSADSGRFKKIVKNIAWFLWLITMLGRIIPLLLNVYYNINNSSTIVIETLNRLILNLDVFQAIILWKYNEKVLHILLSEVLDYTKNIRNTKNDLLYKNLCNYLPICIGNAIVMSIIMIIYICGPIFLKQKLPLMGWFPFSIELYSIRYYAIYAYLVFEIIRIAYVYAAAPFMYMILFSYPITKLQSLSLKLKEVNTCRELNDCIEEHKECIRYVAQLNEALRFIILKGYVNATITVVIAGISMVLERNSLSILRSGLTVALNLLQAYFLAWFADDLYTTSQSISLSIYDSKWPTYALKMKKSLIILICHTQQGLRMSVSGFIPILSKNFYASFLSLSLSYYMALRALFIE